MRQKAQRSDVVDFYHLQRTCSDLGYTCVGKVDGHYWWRRGWGRVYDVVCARPFLRRGCWKALLVYAGPF